MKKTKLLAIIVAVVTVMLVFSVSAFAADTEYTYGDFKYTVLEDDTVKIIGYTGDDANVSVPDEIDGKAVSAIGEYAFESCGTIKSLSIPGSVKELAIKAIHMCDKLETISISGNSLTVIYGTSIESCRALKTVYLPESVETIGVLMQCESLENIVIAEENPYLTSVDGVVYTKDMKTLVKYPQGKKQSDFLVPSGVEHIKNNAFYETGSSIEKIYITTAVKTIDELAFAYSNADIYYEGATIPASWKNALEGKTVVCNSVYSEHTYSEDYTVVRAATLKANGLKAKYCVCGCGDYIDETVIPAIKSVTLSTTQYTHNGKNRTPKVTVKDAEGNTLVKNVDYKTSVASKRSGIGRYTVKVTFIGDYSGTKNVFFYIKPGVTSKVTSTSDNTSVTLKWNKVSGAAGYTVYRYSPSKKAYVKAGTTEGTSLTVSKLYQGTNYTFRVIAYGKTAAGKVYDSNSYKLYKTATCPGVTKSIKVTKSRAEYVTLQWESVKNATGYRVYVYNSQTKKWETAVKATTKLTASVKNLVPGRSYTFAVKAFTRTDSGDIWAKTYTKQTGKTADMTDDYARKLLCEASKVDMKWWPAFYVVEGYESEVPAAVLEYSHIIDTDDVIYTTYDGKTYYYYAVVDNKIKSTNDLRALLGKYFDEEYVEHCLYDFVDYEGKLYVSAYDFDYEVATYYTDSIKKISSTHYRYYLKAHFEDGDKGNFDRLYYDLIYKGGKWVFTMQYEDKRYNGEKADDVDYFYPIIFGDSLIKD